MQTNPANAGPRSLSLAVGNSDVLVEDYSRLTLPLLLDGTDTTGSPLLRQVAASWHRNCSPRHRVPLRRLIADLGGPESSNDDLARPNCLRRRLITIDVAAWIGAAGFEHEARSLMGRGSDSEEVLREIGAIIAPAGRRAFWRDRSGGIPAAGRALGLMGEAGTEALINGLREHEGELARLIWHTMATASTMVVLANLRTAEELSRSLGDGLIALLHELIRLPADLPALKQGPRSAPDSGV